jgi:uncharacterized protein (TIGR03435 family)
MRGLVLLLAAGALHAQPQPAPRFSVASIRPCKADDPAAGRGSKGGNGRRSSSPVTFNLPCLPLRFYINLAYVISDAPPAAVNPAPVLEGGPDWIDSTQYQVSAKTEQPIDKSVMNGPMLRALLEERFHLKLRHETREVGAYALTVAKSGLELRPSDGASCLPRPDDLSISPGAKQWCGMARNSRQQGLITTTLAGGTMSQFAPALRLSGRLIIDRTGVSDTFDIHIEYAADDAAPSDAPSMETALAKLGLRLERITAPREYVIVDHVEPPSGN